MTILKGILAGLFFTSVLVAWYVLIYKMCELIIQWERMMTYGTGF